MAMIIGLMLLTLMAGIAATLALNGRHSRAVATIAASIVLILALSVLANSLETGSVLEVEQYVYYIQSLNIAFTLQLTAIPLILVVMASIVSLAAIFSGNVEREREKTASALLLLFELAAIGIFTSANLLVFFIFWDVGVVALFFMIYLLGSSNRRRAAMKFLMYELLASMLLLLGIMTIYFYTPLHSFDISYVALNAHLISQGAQNIIFLLLFLAFMINLPIFPTHLWLPEAHTEASTQGSMVLSGILTKFGGYGMILLFSMMPIASAYSPEVALLAIVSAFYSVLVLMRQNDIKRIVAYTTIVEMSIILLGISALNAFGTYGAAYAMLAHGLTIAMMFLAAGSVGHIFQDRDIRMVKGVVKTSLSTTYAFLAGTFATTGLPLTAAFIGDILIFLGAQESFGDLGLLPLGAIALMGAYLYLVLNKSFLSAKDSSKNVEYIGLSQKIGFGILLLSTFAFGVFPFILLQLFK
jgi:NADH-quinone oxidoreductase subunit M